MIITRRSLLGLLGGAVAVPRVAMALPAASQDLVVLSTVDHRHSQVTVWRATRARGTILFSHGAASAPGKYAALVEPWVAAGFDVWAPLHVDSTDHPDTRRYPGLASWPARIEDMRALAAHVGTGRYVAAGHSYGALVALTLGGASPTPPPGVAGPLADPRVAAAVAFSPPGPGMGLIDAAGYATLKVPAFIETGTADLPPGAPAPDGWRGHVAAYEAAAPGGNRFALVLSGADHYFGGLICRPELPGPRQSEQLGLAAARSTSFLRAYASGDNHERQALKTLSSIAPITAAGFYRR